MSFDPLQAAGQMFIDTIMGAFSRHAGGGIDYGHGWHLTEMSSVDPYDVRDVADPGDRVWALGFETPITLKGWKEYESGDRGEYSGPHYVKVLIVAHDHKENPS